MEDKVISMVAVEMGVGEVRFWICFKGKVAGFRDEVQEEEEKNIS